MEPLGLLVDTFIQLADRVLNLDKTKIQDRKSLFTEIINPLFEDLEPVASNYMEIFRKARTTFDKGTIQELRHAIEFIGKERAVMFIARIKVEQMAYQVKGLIKDEEVGTFALSILLFFNQTTQIMGFSRTTVFLEELKQIEENAKKNGKLTKEDKTQIIQYIDVTLAILEEYWRNIATSYGKLKIQYLSSNKLTRSSSI